MEHRPDRLPTPLSASPGYGDGRSSAASDNGHAAAAAAAAASTSASFSGHTPTLQDYITIFRRRRATLLYTFALVTVLGVVLTLLTPSTYRAVAYLLVDPPSFKLNQVDSTNPLSDLFTGNQAYKLETQVRMLQSRQLLQEAYKRTGASGDSRPKFQIKSVRETDIIEIAAEGPDPKAAALAANSLLDAYFEQEARNDGQQLRSALAFTEDGMRKAESQLVNAERSLSEFKRRYRVAEMDKSRASQIAAVDKLASDYESLQIRLAGTRSQLAETRQQAAREPRTETGPLPPETDRMVQETERQLAEAEEQGQILRERYTSINDKVVAADTRIASLRRLLRSQRESARRRGETANPAYNRLRDRMGDLDVLASGLSTEAEETGRRLLTARQQLGLFPSRELEMARLERQLALAQANYTLFSQKREDLRLRLEARRPAARVMEQAEPPGRPIRPKRTLSFLLSAFFGAFLAVLLALLQEFLDDRINSAEEAGQILRLPNLGVVPMIVEEKLRLAHTIKGYSPVREAYRSLRTNISFAAVDNPVRTLALTSSTPGEGKSTTTANLAASLAMEGKRVILVDADLRRPTMHKVFHAPQVPGLTDVLVGAADLNDTLHQTEVEGVRLLTAGSPVPNPAEMIGSEAMAHFVDTLRGQADIVLFDSPPVLAVADATLLASTVDGVLFVVGVSEARRGSLRHAMDMLTRARVRVLGLVLNKVEDQRRNHYYYYSSTSSAAAEEQRGTGISPLPYANGNGTQLHNGSNGSGSGEAGEEPTAVVPTVTASKEKHDQ